MSNMLLPLLFLVFIVGLFWFMNRQTRKQQQRRQEQINAIERGDEVVTIGGLHGKVDLVSDTTIDIDCEGIILTFDKAAIKTFNHHVSQSASASTPAAEENSVNTKAKTDSPIDEK